MGDIVAGRYEVLENAVDEYKSIFDIVAYILVLEYTFKANFLKKNCLFSKNMEFFHCFCFWAIMISFS